MNYANVFGSNAGKQCVAMSLCSLIYIFSNRSITDSQDLVEIMNMGNELYSALSRISGQTYLLLTELPTMVTVQNTNYQLEFSESYSGNLHGVTLDEGIPYVMPLNCALECLLQESYNTFLITISCNTVSICCTPNGSLKIFDSHARDLLGMPNSYGTCVLLDIQSIDKLVEYFKSLYTYGNLCNLQLAVSVSKQLYTRKSLFPGILLTHTQPVF